MDIQNEKWNQINKESSITGRKLDIYFHLDNLLGLKEKSTTISNIKEER